MMMQLNPNQQAQSSFLPSDYVKNKGQQRANLAALLLFGVVMVGLAGVFVVNHQRKRSVTLEFKEVAAEYETVAAKIEQLKSLELQRAEMISNAEIVTALIDRVPRSVLLAELLRDMPDQLILSKIDLDGERVKEAPAPTLPSQGRTRSIGTKPGAAKKDPALEATPKMAPPRFRHSLAIEGMAKENQQVADYLASLKQSPLLKNVELQFIEETSINDSDLRKFRVVADIRETADARQVSGAQETTLLDSGPFTRVETEEE